MKKTAKKVKNKVKSVPKAAKSKKPQPKKLKLAPKASAKKAPKLSAKPVPKALKATPPPKIAAKGAPKAALKPVESTKKPKKSEAPQVGQVVALAPTPEEEVILTNADGKQYCRAHDCDNEATTDQYCRYHYLALWKRNKIKTKILQNGKLDKYIEDLTAKYPDKYLEMLRKDLASEKDFNLIVAEMDVEDSGDEADNEEDTSRFIEEVRGGMPSPDDDEGF